MKKFWSLLLTAALTVGTAFPAGIQPAAADWSPEGMDGLKAWYDAADLQLGDGAKVSRWLNRAGNAAYDAAQADESKQPVYMAQGKIGGKPGVRFSQQTHLQLQESFTLDSLSIFAVVNPDELVNAGDANQIFSKLGLAGDHNWYFNLENGGFNFGWKDDGGYRNYNGDNRAVSAGSSYILGGVKDGPGGSQYINGVQIGRLPGSGNPVHNDQPNFIGGGSGPAASMVGTISEILVFDRGLREDEADRVQMYLAGKWGDRCGETGRAARGQGYDRRGALPNVQRRQPRLSASIGAGCRTAAGGGGRLFGLRRHGYSDPGLVAAGYGQNPSGKGRNLQRIYHYIPRVG